VFNDLNGNRQLDGPQELGRLVQTVGGAGFVRVDRDIKRPYSNELSANIEREVVQGLSARASYVYKSLRDVWGEVDVIRDPAYTVPFTIQDPGPDSIRGTADDQTLNTFDRPAAIGSDRVYTNPTDPSNDADFHTVELALNRRFSGKWMLLTSFGYTWLNQLHDVVSSTGATAVAGNLRAGGSGAGPGYYYRPAQTMFGDNGRETSTQWNTKVTGRYVLPFDIGTSGSWRFQSGYQYGRTLSVNFTGDSTQNVRVEPVTANRAPNVAIVDMRFDKSFRFGRFGKLTGMMDVFNLTNSGVVTNFRTTTATANVGGQTVSTYREVIAILDPRIVRFGVRFDF
jgi:hypothetical protein